ncbi:MAG: hypothetical protein AB2689_05375 [Candidatus Thiodiazotropha taylori]
MIKTIILSIGIMSLTGCSAFKVHDKDDKYRQGVPFYAKTGKVKQVTSYTRSWIVVKIDYQQINADGESIKGAERSAVFNISNKSYDQAELLNSFATSDTGGEFSQTIILFKNQLRESCKNQVNCELTPQEIIKESSLTMTKSVILSQELESNSSSYEVIVDYENPYYFNANIPLFGTATATAKLATDGTLTEASSTVDSTKLADSIPLKELLLDKWGLGGAVSDAGTADALVGGASVADRSYLLSISISTNGYKYSISKYHPISSGLNLSPLKLSDDGISVFKAQFGNTSNKKEKKKNAIEFDGSIVLPESN